MSPYKIISKVNIQFIFRGIEIRKGQNKLIDHFNVSVETSKTAFKIGMSNLSNLKTSALAIPYLGYRNLSADQNKTFLKTKTPAPG